MFQQLTESIQQIQHLATKVAPAIEFHLQGIRDGKDRDVVRVHLECLQYLDKQLDFGNGNAVSVINDIVSGRMVEIRDKLESMGFYIP